MPDIIPPPGSMVSDSDATPGQSVKTASSPKRVMTQGDLAPITPATQTNSPTAAELGQLAKQLFSKYEFSVFEVKTDQFGPYNPSYIPIWVLKMMRRDFAVRIGMKALKAPFLNASRYFIYGGDPKARAFTEFWLRPLLPKLLRTASNCIDFGFSPHEIVFDESLPTVDFKLEDDSHSQLRRAIVPRRIVDLDPESVEVCVDTQSMKFSGLEIVPRPVPGRPIDTSFIEPKFIPPTKSFLTTYDSEFGNLRGSSGLIPAYNPWWWKNVGYLFWGRFMERLGMGVYSGRSPTDIRTDAAGNKVDPIKFMTMLLLQLRAGGVITIPFEPDALTQENKWAVELIESKNDGTTFEKWIVHLTISAMRAILIPDRLIVQDGSGSFAAQESSFEQFFQFLEAILAETILEPINTQLIWPICRYNYGDTIDLPRIGATPLNPAIRKQFMELLKQLLSVTRESQEGGKKIMNSAAIDAIKLAEMLGAPIRDKKDWPVSEPIQFGEQVPGQPPEPGKKPGKGFGTQNDTSLTDEDKFGDKNPKDERE